VRGSSMCSCSSYVPTEKTGAQAIVSYGIFRYGMVKEEEETADTPAANNMC